MTVKILVCDPIDDEGIKKLKHEDYKVDIKPSITEDELQKIVPEYEVLIVRSRTKVTRDIIQYGKRLKVIGRAGAGLDNIDTEAAEKKGVSVLNTPEVPADSVAELTIGLMLTLTRSIAFADRSMKEGKWLKKELEGWSLKGKTLGLIGLGNIGSRVAKIAKEIGMKIIIAKRTPPSKETLRALKAKFVTLNDLLIESDIVSIHIPLTQQTKQLISAKEISLMKDGAFLINTSRGGIVDEKALLDALKSGKLSGVALDVYELEPPCNYELVRMPNIVCTPHIGAQTKEAQNTASILLADKIIEFLRSHGA